MRLGGAAAPSPAGSQGPAGMPPADERLVAPPPVGDAGLGGRAQTLGRALLPGCTRPLPPCGSWRLEGGLKKIIT